MTAVEAKQLADNSEPRVLLNEMLRYIKNAAENGKYAINTEVKIKNNGNPFNPQLDSSNPLVEKLRELGYKVEYTSAGGEKIYLRISW